MDEAVVVVYQSWEVGHQRIASLDEQKRLSNYKEALKIFDEEMPWIIILQPIESYGVANNIEFKPYPNQDMPIEDIKLKAAGK